LKAVFIPENCKRRPVAPLTVKLGGQFQTLGVNKAPLISKLESHFKKKHE
jgi:hypothetical protein